jgi:hypothetical protein
MRKKRGEYGFSLLEVVISAILLLFIGAGTLMIVLSNARSIIVARNRSQAAELADLEKERILACPYRQIGSGTLMLSYLPYENRGTEAYITRDYYWISYRVGSSTLIRKVGRDIKPRCKVEVWREKDPTQLSDPPPNMPPPTSSEYLLIKTSISWEEPPNSGFYRTQTVSTKIYEAIYR